MAGTNDFLVSAINEMVGGDNESGGYFPKSMFYNEGWMLRLLLHGLLKKKIKVDVREEANGIGDKPLFPFLNIPEDRNGIQLYSEAQLNTPFCQARSGISKKGLHESNSRVDAIVGQIKPINNNAEEEDESTEQTECRITPSDSCKFLSLFEAKMGSTPAKGVTNKREDYNQISRLAACLNYTLYSTFTINGEKMPTSVYLVLIYPKGSSTQRWLSETMGSNSCLQCLAKNEIKSRIGDYTRLISGCDACDGRALITNKDNYEKWINWTKESESILGSINIIAVTYEEILGKLIRGNDGDAYLTDLKDFYNECRTTARLND